MILRLNETQWPQVQFLFGSLAQCHSPLCHHVSCLSTVLRDKSEKVMLPSGLNISGMAV